MTRQLEGRIKRQWIAEFLLGFCALPLCALFGLLEAALFQMKHTTAVITVLAFALFPIVGAIKSKQKSLLAGLIVGSLATVFAYFTLVPKH